MTKFHLSTKVDLIKPSASLQVAARAKELARKGRDIVNLSLGEPDFAVPTPIKTGLYQALDENKTHYTVSQGILELRKEIASHVGHDVQAEQIVVSSGCKLGIYLALEAILNPGDEVIFFEPAWVSYIHMITLCGGKSINLQTEQSKNFMPAMADLEAALSKKTKAIIINNPNNPSGQLLPKSLLDQIVRLAKEHQLFIIADEIYADILFEKDSFHSLINYDYERIIISSGFSKNFAMTGLRIGYTISHPEVTKAINKLHQHVGTCAPSIAQYSLIGNISAAITHDLGKMIATYEKRRNLLMAGLDKTIFPYIVPQATFYMLLNIRKLKTKSLEAAKLILEEFGVATVPGVAFGESIDDYVRISFATSEEELQKALLSLSKIPAK